MPKEAFGPAMPRRRRYIGCVLLFRAVAIPPSRSVLTPPRAPRHLEQPKTFQKCFLRAPWYGTSPRPHCTQPVCTTPTTNPSPSTAVKGSGRSPPNHPRFCGTLFGKWSMSGPKTPNFSNCGTAASQARHRPRQRSRPSKEPRRIFN